MSTMTAPFHTGRADDLLTPGPAYPRIPSVLSTRQRQREDAEARRLRNWDAGIAAAIQAIPTSDIVNGLATVGYEPDPNFRWTPALANQLTEGIDTDLIPRLRDAVSLEHAYHLSAQMLAKSDHRKNLARLGWQGQALVLAANVIDPAMLATGVVTGGLGQFAAGIGGASRAARLTRMGIVMGAGFGAVEAARAQFNPEIEVSDILASAVSGGVMGPAGELVAASGRATRALAMGAGAAAPAAAIETVANQFREEDERRTILWNGAANFLFGGVLSLLTPAQRRAVLEANPSLASASGKLDAAARRMQRDVEYTDVLDAGGTLTDKGKRYFKDQTPEAVEARMTEALRPLDEEFAEAEAALDAAIDRIQRQRADDVARTPLDLGGGVGFLPPILSPNQVRGWIAESPHARISFEAARRDANAARRANPGTKVVVVEYAGGAFAAFRERKELSPGVWEPEGIGPDIAEPPRRVRTTEPSGEPATAAETGREVDTSAIVAANQERTPFAGGAMGAASPDTIVPDAEAPSGRPPLMAMDFSNVTDARPSMPRLRMGMGPTVAKSEIPSFAKAANIFGKDPLPKADGSPSVYSASERVIDLRDSARARMLTRTDAVYAEHRQRAGDSALSRMAFNEQAARAWRRAGTPEAAADPSFAKAADVAQKIVGEVHAFAKWHGVPGIDNVMHRLNYVPRLWRQDLIDDMVARFGQDQVIEKVLAPAILRGEWNLTPAQAVAVSKAILKNGGRRMSATEHERGQLFAGQADRLRMALEDAGVGDAEIDQIVRRVFPNRDTKGTPTRGRERIDLDELYGDYLTDPKTGERVMVGIEDLLENNIETLVSKYAHQLYGASALHSAWRALWPENPPTTIGGALARLERDASDLGFANDRKTRADLARLEAMMKIVGGVPLHEDSMMRQAIRILQNTATFRVMSNLGTGMLNAAEVTHPIAELGWGNIVRHGPGIVRIFKRAENGELTAPLAREMEAIGIGMSRVTSRVTPRMIADDAVEAGMNKAELISQHGARFALDVSGQSFGQMLLESATTHAYYQKWANFARGVDTIDDLRLRSAGLERPMADRIIAQLKQHAEFEQDGTTLADLNVESWDDVEAASAFRAATSKTVKRLALRPDPTELPLWMHSDTGRIFMFLRKYTFAAWDNKLLHSFQARDMIAAKFIVASTLAGALVYVGRTYLESVGRPDADEFRKKRLSPEAIATAAIGRSSWASILPGMVDTGLYAAGRPQVFAHARTTGLASNFVEGNPIINQATTLAFGVPRAVIGPVWSDYQFSKTDARNLTTGTWLPNVIGARAVLEQLIADLPDRSRGN